MVVTTDDLEYEPAFDWYGLELEPPAGGAPKPYLGVKTEKQGGRITVTEVVEGSPAHGALNPGDEIIAFDAYRVEDLGTHLGRLEPNDRVKVTISRRGVLTALEVTLGEKPRATWKLRPEKVRSATQIQRFKRLLAP
jgi:predicted metalloprotease with PDZ domain